MLLFDRMKVVTVQEFYRDTALVDALHYGEQWLVTEKGKLKFVVSKASRPRMTRKLAEARAVGNPKKPRFDGTTFLASLKK